MIFLLFKNTKKTLRSQDFFGGIFSQRWESRHTESGSEGTVSNHTKNSTLYQSEGAIMEKDYGFDRTFLSILLHYYYTFRFRRKKDFP